MFKSAVFVAATAIVVSASDLTTLTTADKAWQQALDRKVEGRGRPTTFVPRGRPQGGLRGSNSPKSPKSPKSLSKDAVRALVLEQGQKIADLEAADIAQGQKIADLEAAAITQGLKDTAQDGLISGLRTDVDN